MHFTLKKIQGLLLRLVNNDVDISHRTIVIGNMASSLTRKSSNRVNNIFSDKKSTKKKATFALEANEALIHVNNAREDITKILLFQSFRREGGGQFLVLQLKYFLNIKNCSWLGYRPEGIAPQRS